MLHLEYFEIATTIKLEHTLKKLLIGFCLSLVTVSVFANNLPPLKASNLGYFEGKDIISKCTLNLEENAEGMIVATFSKGGLIYKSRPAAPNAPIMVSSNNQVWFDFSVEGMVHVNLMFNNEYDLEPTEYVVIEGRSNKIFKCRNLKS